MSVVWVGYIGLDVADVVPGVLTVEAPAPVQADYPEVAIPLGAAAQEVPLVLDTDAPLPSASQVQALAEELQRDSRTGVSTGISVVDIATGEVLAAVRADDPQIPASGQKWVTAIAALTLRGGDYRLETQALLSEPRESQVARVSLVAGGDVILAGAYGHGDVSTEPNGFAGLADVADATAEQLPARSIDRVEVRVDDSSFVGPSIGRGWPASTVSRGYAAPATGIAVNLGKKNNELYAPRWDDPSLHALEVFAALLADQGISVSVRGRGAADDDAVVIATVESAPLRDVVAHMMHYSDNTVAEVLLMDVARAAGEPGSTAAGAQVAREVLADLGVTMTGVAIEDGSGFSRGNQLTPVAVTDLLVRAAQDPVLDDAVRRAPVSGLHGTLDDRLQGQAAGVVRAKTGSLIGVTSLSGTVVTADGRWLAFAVLADKMPYGQDAPRAAIDEFVRALAACGCR